jgi:hypothetical protein
MPSGTSSVNLLRTPLGSSKSANSAGSWSTAPRTDPGWRITAASAKIPALLVAKIAAGTGPRPASSAAASFKERFPEAKAVATASTAERMASQLDPDGVFQRAFPGRLPDAPGVAEPLDGAAIDLEGPR